MNRKIADNVKNNPDACLRLAAEYMQKAMRAAKRGDTVDVCACVRLAASFENRVDRAWRLDYSPSGQN